MTITINADLLHLKDLFILLLFNYLSVQYIFTKRSAANVSKQQADLLCSKDPPCLLKQNHIFKCLKSPFSSEIK